MGTLRLLSRFSYYNTKATTVLALCVVLILVGASYMVLLNGKEDGVEVDGKFSDWDDVETVEDTRTTENPSIDLVRYRALLDDTHLSLYLETRSALLRGLGENGDSIQIFVDTDQDPETGYALPSFGAEYLLEIYGKDGKVLSSNLYLFDTNHRTDEKRATNDWNAWAPMFAVEVAVSGNKLETQLWHDELQLDGTDMDLWVRLMDSAGNVAESPVFNTGLRLVQLSLNSELAAPLQPFIMNDVLSLDLLPQGEDVVLDSLLFEESSTAVARDFENFALYNGDDEVATTELAGNTISFENLNLPIPDETTLTLKAKLAISVVSGHVLSLTLTDALCGDAPVTMEIEEARGYLIAPPVDYVVDGLFAEWQNPREDVDEEPIANENVDITHYDAASKVEDTHFYLRVDGEILAGVDVPSSRAMQIPSGTGGGGSGGEPGDPGTGSQEEKPLPVQTGEDAVYIFLDTEDGGYESPHIEFGADYMIEVKGQNGEIISARYMEFDGANEDEWKWRFVMDIPTAAGLNEMETAVDETPKGVYFHVVSWDNEDEDHSRRAIWDTHLPDIGGTRDTPSWPADWGNRIVVEKDEGGNLAWDIVNGYAKNDAQGSGENLYLRMEIGDNDIDDTEKGSYYWIFYFDTDCISESDHADYRLIVYGTTPTVELYNWGGSNWGSAIGTGTIAWCQVPGPGLHRHH